MSFRRAKTASKTGTTTFKEPSKNKAPATVEKPQNEDEMDVTEDNAGSENTISLSGSHEDAMIKFFTRIFENSNNKNKKSTDKSLSDVIIECVKYARGWLENFAEFFEDKNQNFLDFFAKSSHLSAFFSLMALKDTSNQPVLKKTNH